MNYECCIIQEVGEWKGRSAGGCGNNRDTYKNNPIYQINLEGYSDENDLCIDLKGPKYANLFDEMKFVFDVTEW